MSLNCISSVLIPTASGGEGEPCFSTHPPLRSITAASSMLTKCKCQNPMRWAQGQVRLHCLHRRPKLRDTGWQAIAFDTCNYRSGKRTWWRAFEKMSCARVGKNSLSYDIITQYTVVFSSSATENTGLARLSDTLLIYKSKEICFGEIFPWFKDMPIITVAAPLRQVHKIPCNKGKCLRSNRKSNKWTGKKYYSWS